MDGWMDAMDGWMEGWMDGWMDGWISGWMDGWMDLCALGTGSNTPTPTHPSTCLGPLT